MTKSRRRPALFLCALIVPACPAAAQTHAMPAPSPIIVAPPNPLGDLAARQLAEQVRCQSGGTDAIVVCGQLVRGGGGYRVPHEPEPGARVHLVAGELPSAMAAMGADHCTRLCEQPVMFNLLDPGSIVRGIDRILGGD